MNVVIVGVGALGSHVLQFMRNVTEDVTVIDFDRVESKNTQSQFHGKPSVGKPKVLSLSQAMQYFWGFKVKAVPHKLVEENCKQLLNADLVIDCLDNAASRVLIQKYVRNQRIPCLHGALAADGSFGRAVWDERFEIDVETEGAATCEDGEHLPYVACVASFIARAAQQFLKENKKYCYEVGLSDVIRYEVKKAP